MPPERSAFINVAPHSNEIAQEYVIHTSPQTLGHAAVLNANQVAAIITGSYEAVENQTDQATLDAIVRKKIGVANRELSLAAKSIRAISDDNAKYLEDYLDSPLTSPFLKALKEETKEGLGYEPSWREWLGQHATPEQMLNFLQFHNRVVEKQQEDPSTRGLLAMYETAFRKTAKRYKETGNLVKDLSHEASVPVMIGDVFSMVMKERAGYYDPQNSQIHIQQGAYLDESGGLSGARYSIDHAAIHEYVHAMLGEAYKRADGPLAARWVNEAITENITWVMEHETKLGLKKQRPYAEERELLNFLLSRTKNKSLAYKLSMRAFSGGKDDEKEFLACMDIAWQVDNVIEKVTEAILAEEYALAGDFSKVKRAHQVEAIKTVHHRLVEDPKSILSYHDEAKTLLFRDAAHPQ